MTIKEIKDILIEAIKTKKYVDYIDILYQIPLLNEQINIQLNGSLL